MTTFGTIDGNQILSFPNTGANTLTPNQHEYLWNDTDDNGLRINDISFTANNAVIRTAILASLRTTSADGSDGFIMDDTTIIFDGDDTQQGDASGTAILEGTNRFRNCTFLRNETDAGNNQRIILGRFITDRTVDTDPDKTRDATLEFTNCRFVATDNPFAILNIGIGDFVFNGNTLIGAVGGQFYQGFISVGTVWPNIGAAGPTSGNQYYARAIHQDLPSQNNGFANGDNLPTTNAIFLIGDDVSLSAINDVRPEFNQNGAMIKVNNLVGGSAEAPSFHQDRGAANPAAAYSVIGWKPVFSDGDNVIGDVSIRFEDPAYLLSEIGANTSAQWLQTIRSTRVAPNTPFDAGMDGADFRGYWLLTNVMRWSGVDNQSIPIPANSTFRAWSFSHDLVLGTATDLQSVNTTLPTRTVTNARGLNENALGSAVNGADDFVDDVLISLPDAFVGTYTATTAPDNATAVTTLDDAYAALRRSWYDNNITEEFTLGDVANSRLTLNRNTALNNTANLYSTTAHTINTAGLTVGALITGVNATGATVSLGNRAFPAGAGEVRAQINGGTWVDPSDAQMVDFISNTAIQLSSPANLDWRTWDFNVLNNSDLTVVNVSGSPLQIFVTPAQFALLGSPADSTGATGISYVQLVTPFDFVFRNQALFDTDGTGIGGLLAIRRRVNDQQAWQEVPSHPLAVEVTAGTSRMLTVANEPQADTEREYLLIWRPLDARYETSFQVFDLTGVNYPSQQAAEPYTVNATRIPDVLLPTGFDIMPYLDTSQTLDVEGFILQTLGTGDEIARVTWRPTTVNSLLELEGTITGTDTEDNIGVQTGTLNGSATQALMRSAYLSPEYLNLLIARGLDEDIIQVSSNVLTLADGEYIQLTTGDGTQQQITGLEGTDVDGNDTMGLMVNNLQATISGTDGTEMISFPAVQIFDNPLGISAGQVRDAVIADLQAINGNVVVASVKPPAVQTAQSGNVQI